MSDAPDNTVTSEDNAGIVGIVGKAGFAEFEPGTLLSNRYRVISKCGEGGMGVVYKVEQIFVGKILALKTISRKDVGEAAIRRFQHEARAAFAINHPNIISVHDFGLLDDETPFLAMDFIEGETLSQLTRPRGQISVEEAIDIFVPVCFGLYAAHCEGIVHRDLKPSNIMIVKGAEPGSEGSVKVVDFGIAKLTQHDCGEIQALTRTGEIFGSPLYMSPEQCKGEHVDCRSDIYSLGCVLFESLAGAAPLIGNTALSTMMKHLSDSPPTLAEASLGKTFPPKLEQMMAKMLAKAPQDRYENLGIVAHELTALGQTTGKAGIFTSAERSWRNGSGAGHGEKKENATTQTPRVPLSVVVVLMLLTAVIFSTIGYFARNLSATQEPINPAQKGTQSDSKQSGVASADPTTETNPVFSSSISSEFIKAQDEPGSGLAVEMIKERLRQPDQQNAFAVRLIAIDDNSMKAIAETPWVKFAKFSYCHFDMESLRYFALRKDFQRFYASGSNLTDRGAYWLSRCSSIHTLHLDNVENLTDAGVKNLCHLKQLRELEISRSKITAAAIKDLSSVANLRWLRIRFIQLPASAFKPLTRCPKLAIFQLDGNEKVGDDLIPILLEMKNLEELEIRGTQVSERALKDLLKGSHHLGKVYVHACPNLNAEAVARLQARFPKVVIDDKSLLSEDSTI